MLIQMLFVLMLNSAFFAKSHEGGSYRCALTATTAAVAGTAAGAVVGFAFITAVSGTADIITSNGYLIDVR